MATIVQHQPKTYEHGQSQISLSPNHVIRETAPKSCVIRENTEI